MSPYTSWSESRRRWTLAVVVLSVLATDAGVARWLQHQGQPVPEWPLLVDLLAVLPLAWWMLMRPRARTALWGMLGMVSLGITAGAWILPDTDKQWWTWLEALRWLGLAALLLAQLMLVAQALRELWLIPPGQHPEPVLMSALARRFRDHPIRPLLQADARLWLYAWPGRQVQQLIDNGLHFETWRQGQNLSNQQAFGILLAVELPLAHGLMHLWSPALAWTVSALSLYGGLFLWAEYRTTRWRPISLRADALHLRSGVLVDLALPLGAISAVTRLDRPAPRAKGRWRIAGMGRTNLCLHLRPDCRLPTVLGERTVSEICIGVDEPERLIAALRERLETR
ncbi:hypothetical protein KAK06_04785 [Ideonella sp. 4Y11]|uniref:PH domain-containing protein n=1 Tax=Ideonella aquatica TaxID=2824119 RepID=A0A940YI57_9BURK|nr:hypothetical protein [Ideonella aquatica]MBQ0958264.1 hypothetical protein [Ideonella aquatica]